MASEPQRPRVRLADDDSGMHTAISRLLSLSCDVVGSVANSASLFDAVAQLHPDVVLLDLSLPGDPSRSIYGVPTILPGPLTPRREHTKAEGLAPTAVRLSSSR